MHPSVTDGQPAGDAGPAPSWWRRRSGVTTLVVVGIVVAAVAGIALFGVTKDRNSEPAIGAGVKPPACAEPGTADLVEPEQGSAFRFTMPECFRSGDALVTFPTDPGDGTNSVVLVPVDITLASGESVAALVRVSVVDIGTTAVTATSQEVEEMVRRTFDITATTNVTMVRRTVDGARGWGFHIDDPDRTLVAWLFLKGTTQLSIVCRWSGEDLEARMLAGCNRIVDTLSIA